MHNIKLESYHYRGYHSRYLPADAFTEPLAPYQARKTFRQRAYVETMIGFFVSNKKDEIIEFCVSNDQPVFNDNEASRFSKKTYQRLKNKALKMFRKHLSKNHKKSNK